MVGANIEDQMRPLAEAARNVEEDRRRWPSRRAWTSCSTPAPTPSTSAGTGIRPTTSPRRSSAAGPSSTRVRPVVFVPARLDEQRVGAIVEAGAAEADDDRHPGCPVARPAGGAGVARVSYGPMSQNVALTALQELVEEVHPGRRAAHEHPQLRVDLDARLKAASRPAPAPRSAAAVTTPPGDLRVPWRRPARSSGSTPGTCTATAAVHRLSKERWRTCWASPAAVFPSGVMGQQAACGPGASGRLAPGRAAGPFPPARAREDGPRPLHDFRFEHLTVGRTATGGRPARTAGRPGRGASSSCRCATPAACSRPGTSSSTAAARDLGVPLHVDGARLWESSRSTTGRLAEIAALADSVYVSFTAQPGRRCCRGTGRPGRRLPELATPDGQDAVPTPVRPRRPRRAASTRRGSGSTSPGRARSRPKLVGRVHCVDPDPPHTNTFLVHAPGSADAVNERLAGFMERASWWCRAGRGGTRSSPGWSPPRSRSSRRRWTSIRRRSRAVGRPRARVTGRRPAPEVLRLRNGGP